MSNPSTFKEVNFVLQELERRLGSVLKIGAGIVSLLGVVFLTALLMYHQIGTVSADAASIKSTVDGLAHRFGGTETAINRTRDQILDRVQSSTMAQIAGGFYVTNSEAVDIRDFLKLPPKDTRQPSKISLWTHVSREQTKPLPVQLTQKDKKLRGMRYVIDPDNNALGLVEPSQNVVIAII